MSNVNYTFGFLAIGRTNGGPLSASQYAKVVAHTQALFNGDIVSKSAVSGVSPDTGLPIPGCTSLQNGTPGTTLWLGANLNFGAAATITPHWVFDALDTIFIGQGNDNTSLTQAAVAGKNVAFVTGAGNATTQKSTMSFASASFGTTITGNDVRALRLHNRVGNVEGAYAVVEVLIVKHFYAQGSVGV